MKRKINLPELEQLKQFVLDPARPIDPDLVSSLADFNAAVVKAMLKRQEGLVRKMNSLERKNNRLTKREQEAIEAGLIKQTGLDSYEVAKALLYQLQHLKTYRLTRTKVVFILYEMYASWLVSKQERLFDEQPVATEWGPQFWRVYKRMNVMIPVSDEDWRDLASKNPGVAQFCRNAARKYYDYAEKKLQKTFKESLPYKNASKEKNDGKWNKEITDQDIISWKKSQS